MYAKCGHLEDARKVFDSLSTRNAVTWNAMINGYGRNNEGRKATACFEEMSWLVFSLMTPHLLSFLKHAVMRGLVSKGRQYFDDMWKHHGLDPTTEHYVPMVDLLGRAGHLELHNQA